MFCVRHVSSATRGLQLDILFILKYFSRVRIDRQEVNNPALQSQLILMQTGQKCFVKLYSSVCLHQSQPSRLCFASAKYGVSLEACSSIFYSSRNIYSGLRIDRQEVNDPALQLQFKLLQTAQKGFVKLY